MVATTQQNIGEEESHKLNKTVRRSTGRNVVNHAVVGYKMGGMKGRKAFFGGFLLGWMGLK